MFTANRLARLARCAKLCSYGTLRYVFIVKSQLQNMAWNYHCTPTKQRPTYRDLFCLSLDLIDSNYKKIVFFFAQGLTGCGRKFVITRGIMTPFHKCLKVPRIFTLSCSACLFINLQSFDTKTSHFEKEHRGSSDITDACVTA